MPCAWWGQVPPRSDRVSRAKLVTTQIQAQQSPSPKEPALKPSCSHVTKWSNPHGYNIRHQEVPGSIPAKGRNPATRIQALARDPGNPTARDCGKTTRDQALRVARDPEKPSCDQKITRPPIRFFPAPSPLSRVWKTVGNNQRGDSPGDSP